MDNSIKKLCAIFMAALLGGAAYYGSFLPLRKSQLFIGALRSLDKVQSVQEFKKIMSEVLDAPSPIGQEELVRNITNSILGTVQQSDNREIIVQLVEFVSERYRPIIERGVGMSFEQNLYVLGTLHEFAYLRTQDPAYLAAAKSYYSEGLRLGPKRPQFLYGMFDIYRIEGNTEGVKAIAEQALSHWPGDEKMKKGLEEYLATAQAAPKN